FPASDARRKRNVPRLRSLHGDTPTVACDYNTAMEKIWTSLWLSKEPSESHKDLMVKYNEFCESRRKANMAVPEEYLPVSIRDAKLFVKKKDKERAQPISQGCLDEKSRTAVSELPLVLASSEEAVWSARERDNGGKVFSIPVPRTETAGTAQAPGTGDQRNASKSSSGKDRPTKRQRCRTCGDFIGKDGHPRGQCPASGPSKAAEDERTLRARAEVEKAKLEVPDSLPKGEKRCGLCRLSRGDGQHRVRYNVVIYCPYADPESVRVKFDEEVKAVKKAKHDRYNKRRKMK
ncbi:hypothetical protein FOZ63_013634, partial [Perkinsus olseni]